VVAGHLKLLVAADVVELSHETTLSDAAEQVGSFEVEQLDGVCKSSRRSTTRPRFSGHRWCCC